MAGSAPGRPQAGTAPQTRGRTSSTMRPASARTSASNSSGSSFERPGFRTRLQTPRSGLAPRDEIGAVRHHHDRGTKAELREALHDLDAAAERVPGRGGHVEVGDENEANARLAQAGAPLHRRFHVARLDHAVASLDEVPGEQPPNEVFVVDEQDGVSGLPARRRTPRSGWVGRIGHARPRPACRRPRGGARRCRSPRGASRRPCPGPGSAAAGRRRPGSGIPPAGGGRAERGRPRSVCRRTSRPGRRARTRGSSRERNSRRRTTRRRGRPVRRSPPAPAGVSRDSWPVFWPRARIWRTSWMENSSRLPFKPTGGPIPRPMRARRVPESVSVVTVLST